MNKDMLEKNLLAYNDVFAEVFNQMVFYGTGIIIDPDDLEDAKTRSVYLTSSNEDNPAREQERDVAKYWKKGKVILCLMGLENQTDIDNTMPVRIMGYEGADYRSQMITHNEALRAARESGDKKALKAARRRKFYPVITAVLYYGIKRRWRKPKSLYDCLDMPPGFERIVENRHINVIELAWMPDEQEAGLKTDMRLLVNMLKQLRITGKYVPKDSDEVIHINALIWLLREITGNRDLYDDMLLRYTEKRPEGGAIKVMDIFGGVLEKGRIEGRAEERIQLMNFMKQEGIPQEVLAKYEAMYPGVVLKEGV